MASETTALGGVHFVGSVPLSSTEEVFTKLCKALPGRLVTIPDGETGTRGNYIGWELERFPKETHEFFLGGVPLPEGHSGIFTQEDIKPSQYDIAAIESYQKFVALRNKGIIPANVRFQVSLPAPLACIQGHLRNEFHAQLEPFYEKRIYDAIQSIINTIPAKDLAIQFDLCFEVSALEYERGRLTGEFFRPHFTPIREGVLERVKRVCALVPEEVALGLHLCYGDYGHQHFIEPVDTGLLVDFANDVAHAIQPHPVAWVHMPVPKNRDDREYFAPLERLDIGSDGRLYLGLVHPYDEEGTRRRIEAARSVVADFGVATECGMGRTPPEELDSILQISKAVTTPALPSA